MESQETADIVVDGVADARCFSEGRETRKLGNAVERMWRHVDFNECDR
jgi:hypothetical protein